MSAFGSSRAIDCQVPSASRPAMTGTAELGRDVLQMPVRVTGPSGISGLIDTIQDPSFATAVGLLRWGAHQIAMDDPLHYESAPGNGGLGRIRSAIRSIFP